jgi:membrane-bound serine protease (ClpP class)
MRSKTYVIFSVTTGLLEELALAAIVFWLLPGFGINIPLWALVILMVALGVYNYIGYTLGRKALLKRPMLSPEAIIGSRCQATTPLAPEGYVRVAGELWRASSSSTVGPGESVVIVGIKGMTLLVSPASKNNHANRRADYLS